VAKPPAGANSAMRFIDPAALQRIGSLELVARTVVDGFMTGLHRSPYLGFSVDFAEHRQYMPGDDIRRIDWRLYARTDRFHLKLYEAETNANFMVLVDTSASMDFSANGVRKIDYARMLAASLTYFSSGQRDRVGLITFDDDLRDYVPPSAKHLDVVLHTLAAAEPRGVGDLHAPFKKAAELLKRSGIVVIVSDLYEPPEQILAAVNQLRFSGQDVVVFHTLDPAELEFQYPTPAPFEDLETGERIPIIPERLRERYQGLVSDHVKELAERFAANRIDYVVANTGEPLDRVLFEYLLARHRRIKSR
jgi:uncharacterized protein (DUF58 family)